ncbi:energy transducer TonB [Thalassomonas haliotis]|uniref:Energy transducer TonB n=1 Tax=Thalassomonas haliotis TaxID=485448 RepID=A0ABY7VFR8_9GAMM|nr:energy transducer TonB [Thalassomonas haliotis]WDE12232.1 energy transducer TonB [Thalassomonas haliotis]
MKSILLTFFLLPLMACSAIAVEFTPAKMLKDKRLTVPTTANLSRLEGWVLLHYMVDIDGKAKHIEVLNKSEQLDVSEELTDALAKLDFSPALLNQKPVPSGDRLFYYTNKSLVNVNNDDVSPGFNSRYTRAGNYLANKEFGKAKEVLDELQETNSKNLQEQALSAWLHSQYYFSQNNWPAYGKQTKIASLLQNRLPTKWAVTTMQNLMQWHVFKKEYAAAFNALNQIQLIEGAHISEKVYQTMFDSLQTSLQNDTNIELEQTLSDNHAWLHQMSRSKLSIRKTQGTIHAIEVRCKNTRFVLTEQEAKAFAMDVDDIDCAILIKGENGTRISLVESGDLYQFTALN